MRLFGEQGYGFIQTAEADEYYFGEENVAAHAFDQLNEGNQVHFIADLNADKPQAKRLTLARHYPTSA